MKAAILSSAFAMVACFGVSAFAQGTCSTGGGQPDFGQPGAGPVSPHATPSGAGSVAPNRTSTGQKPSAPRARINVISTNPQESLVDRTAATAPSAKLAPITEPSRPEQTSATDNVETLAAIEEKVEKNAAINPALAALVGDWSAVARHGDGELTTVELQLDDRGWATLTVPGSDGKPTSTKRRVEFEDAQLKLVGEDSELLLGKLVEFDSRQFVLERTSGQVTFVRR